MKLALGLEHIVIAGRTEYKHIEIFVGSSASVEFKNDSNSATRLLKGTSYI